MGTVVEELTANVPAVTDAAQIRKAEVYALVRGIYVK